MLRGLTTIQNALDTTWTEVCRSPSRSLHEGLFGEDATPQVPVVRSALGPAQEALQGGADSMTCAGRALLGSWQCTPLKNNQAPRRGSLR